MDTAPYATQENDWVSPILKLIADGHTSREIAGMLFLSLKTVMGHRARIMEKLDLHSGAELIKYAIRKGLIVIDT